MAVIDSLISLGDDQQTNQFEIAFPGGIPGATIDPVVLALRMDQQLDTPQRGVGTYEYFYQGIKIIKTNYMEETDKRFNLSFRLDQNWDVDAALDAWFLFTFNEKDGTAAPDSDARTDLLLKAYGPNKELKKTLEFIGTKIINRKETAFDQNTGEPTRIECEFIYYKRNSLTPSGV